MRKLDLTKLSELTPEVNVAWLDSDMNLRYKMLRHTVQNERALRSFRSTRHQDNQ